MSALRTLSAKHPMLSNMLLYFGLYGGGDLSRQIIQKKDKLDYLGAARIGVVGSFMLSPLLFKWYKYLDTFVKGTGPKAVVKKIVWDQAVAGPGGVIIFFSGSSLLEGKKDIFKDLREKGLRSFLTGCVFWPTAQIINFAFLPTQWRTPYVGCAAFVWCNIMSYIKSLDSSDSISQSETTHT